MTSRNPNPGATPAERRLWGSGMVPGSVARNKGRRSSAEQVAAERDKARRTREDDWPTGKPKPARLGEQVEVAGGMRAWVREEPDPGPSPAGERIRQAVGSHRSERVSGLDAGRRPPSPGAGASELRRPLQPGQAPPRSRAQDA
jgi:hypothetical protein